MKCSIIGCSNDATHKGMCGKHYARLVRHGDPMVTKRVLKGFFTMHKSEYNSWHSMKQRCLNKNNPNYKWYGQKGVSICTRWLDEAYGFINFYEDMGPRPHNTSLDRIDVNGDYEPSNCRWSNPRVQSSNQRSRRKYSDTVGVSYSCSRMKWYAHLYKNGRRYKKYFQTEEEAIRYRKKLESLY